jgi:O-antigen ligase
VDTLRPSSCSREALVLAVCAPLLCFHQRYSPDLLTDIGSTSATVAVSDLAALVIVIAAVTSARRLGIEPLRRGGWTLVAAVALMTMVLAWTLLGPVLTDGYPLGNSLVSAAKFVEYGLLALAVPLIVRRRGDAVAVAIGLIAVAVAAAVVGVLQIIGLVGNLDNVPAGRRMPSFLGYHDFAALAGTVLAIAIAVIASGTWSRLRAPALAGAVAGAIGVVIGGALATVIALIAGSALALACMVVWKTASARRVLAIGALLLVIGAGSLALRGNDLQDYIGFLGNTKTEDQNIETYSQRTVLAYIGLKIFLDHPLTGVGWQAAELPTNFESHLDAAHRRFPDVTAGAFPSAEHRWGVQNAYVQAAADMGILGLLVLLATVVSAFLRSATRSLRGTLPPGPLALTLAIALLVGATEWAALGLVPGVPTTALLWLAIGGAVALPRGGALPDDVPDGG